MEKGMIAAKKELLSGVFRLAWEEMKTMNMAKMKSLYRVFIGYFHLKLSRHRKKDVREISYRISA